VGPFLLHHLHRLIRSYGFENRVPFQFKEKPQYFADARFVVHEKDAVWILFGQDTILSG
jgi:hypothetical protein